MAAISASSGGEARAAIFRRLARRHVAVRVLRIAVPLIGLLALAALLVQIWLASLLGSLGIDGIRLERDTLIVDNPAMSGTLAGVGRYQVTAETASTPVSASSGVDLTALRARLTFDSGATADLFAPTGHFAFGPRRLVTDDELTLSTSDGIAGEARGASLDLPTQAFEADQGVTLRFPDGSTLIADTMTFDANSGALSFARVRLTIMPSRLTPGTIP